MTNEFRVIRRHVRILLRESSTVFSNFCSLSSLKYCLRNNAANAVPSPVTVSSLIFTGLVEYVISDWPVEERHDTRGLVIGHGRVADHRL